MNPSDSSHPTERGGTTNGEPDVSGIDPARFIFDEWHRRARDGDVPGLLELYADDAVVETPLAPRILDQPTGVLAGHGAIGRFLEEGTRRRPNELVRWFRTDDFLWDGHTLVWEYPRATPNGDQLDILEVMELRGRQIIRHRIYWGWRGVELLIANATGT